MTTTIFSGYDPDFLSTRHAVPLPRLTAQQQADRVAAPDHPDGLLHQANYTVALNAARRLAWYSAANVDATKFQPVTRRELTSYWRREKTLPADTMTTGRWYRLSEKKLQRGHLTPADCMEWGTDPAEAIRNANTTFHYSNAVPQMQRLNGREWGMLERYVGEECIKAGQGRLCVHTGPVLQTDDPVYVHRVEGRSLVLPVLFWKVIWYLDSAGRLSRIGFIMSQANLLEASGLIERERGRAKPKGPFAELGSYKTYQVGVARLQQLTGLEYAAAQREPYAEDRPVELLLREIDVPVPDGEEDVTPRGLLPLAKQSQRVLVGLSL